MPVTILYSSHISLSRGCSSAGRALAWHARGRRFDPVHLHQTFHYPETIHAHRAEMRAVGAYSAIGPRRQSTETHGSGQKSVDATGKSRFTLPATLLFPVFHESLVSIYPFRHLADRVFIPLRFCLCFLWRSSLQSGFLFADSPKRYV